MSIKTSWVTPPHTIGGLDHIGTQGPCIQIYSQLLPGITNVTDRARYYSFYPWLIRSYEERDIRRQDFNAFLEAYRRADCLFTMIAERHAQVMGDDAARHGPAMVGRETLNDAVRLVGEGKSIRLSTYTTREQSTERYFANKLGGLGQYYAGTLTQLGILATVEKPWLSYTRERGEPIAQAFNMGVDGRSFWQAVDADIVSAKTLDALQDFCPCCLPQRQGEQAALLDIFFDRKSEFEAQGAQRRKSLALLLHLAGALQAAGLSALDEATFRAATYTESLVDGTAWRPPASLAHTRLAWAYYVRNDLVSVAMQKAFSISLTALVTEPVPPSSIEEFSQSLAKRPELLKALGKLKAKTFGALCSSLESGAPALGDFMANEHELSWAAARISRERLQLDQEPAFLASVVNMLALLRMRENQEAPAYGSLTMDQAQLQDSPINLGSFRERCVKWNGMTLSAVVADLIAWILKTHLHVALRKLRQSSTATFRVHPTERGIEARGDIPVPAKTNPRIRQAIRILRDVGALARETDSSGDLRATTLGIQLFEAAHE
ncbi:MULTISPECIES: hypothetical protein [Variovorax]|uniref:hypothetical protein n=1 Tax=Variovorax TaxID=34072 RepID=UPI001611F444|nr:MULTISPECIES: hypothetical protein [unclassified Variovorax]MBB3639665.1 hypothetical protein [Variovorax sp. BK613]MDN6886840.1 hypothetical protein [Variovorax sp. CAN15]